MTDAARIAVSFGADTSDLDKAVSGATAKVDKFGKDAKAAGERGTRALETGAAGAAGAIRAMLAAAAGFSVAQFSAKATTDAAALTKLSAAAGLTTAEFQRLTAGAKLAGVTDDISGALASFSEKATLARSKMGELYETLKFAAPALADQLKDTKTTTQALELYAEAIRRVEGADAKATLAKKAFGESGIALLPILQNGAAGIEAMQREADKFGAVVSDKAIAASKELKKETNLLGAEIEAAFLNKAAPAIEAAANGLRKLRDAMREVGKGNLAAAGDALGGFKDNVDALAAKSAELSAQLIIARHELSEGAVPAKNYAERVAEITKEMERLDRAMVDAMDKRDKFARQSLKGSITNDVGGDSFTLKEKPDYSGVDAVLAAVQALAAAKGELLRSAQLEGAQQIEAARRLLEERRMTETQFGEIRKNVTAATEAKVVEIRKASAAELRSLEIEAQTARGEGFAAISLQYEADLKKWQEELGKKLISEEQFQQARENLNAVAGERIKTEMQRVGDEARKSTEGVASAIETSLSNTLTGTFTSAEDAARQLGVTLLKSISEAIVKALVLAPLMESIRGTGASTGLLGQAAGALGGMLGGGGATTAGWGASISYGAEGGGVRAGQPININERAGRAREVFVPEVAGRMVPGERAGGAGVSGSAGNVVNHFTIDARGADAGVSERVMAAVLAAEKARSNSVANQQAFAKRFPTRR